MLEAPYLVLLPGDGISGVYLHVRAGRGRQARRRLVSVHHVELPLTADNLPDILRAFADHYESTRSGSAPRARGGAGAP